MTTSHLFVLWLHLVAAVTWIGGMMFLSLVLAPLVRSRKAAPEFMALFRTAALRFRVIVWSAITVLLTTGALLVQRRGIPLLEPTRWPQVLQVKVSLILLLLILTVTHDVFLGPNVSRISALPETSRTDRQKLLVRTSRWLPRIALLLTLAVLLTAVILARL